MNLNHVQAYACTHSLSHVQLLSSAVKGEVTAAQANSNYDTGMYELNYCIIVVKLSHNVMLLVNQQCNGCYAFRAYPSDSDMCLMISFKFPAVTIVIPLPQINQTRPV